MALLRTFWNVCLNVEEGNEMCHSDLTSHFSGHGLGVSPDIEKVNAVPQEDLPRRWTPGSRAERAQQAQGVGGRRPGAGTSQAVRMPLHSKYGENRGSDSAAQERGWAVPGLLGDLHFGRAGLAAAKAAGRWSRLQVRFAPEDFPVSWAEGQPGTRTQSPPRSGAGPPGIRPAARPRRGCDLRGR